MRPHVLIIFGLVGLTLTAFAAPLPPAPATPVTSVAFPVQFDAFNPPVDHAPISPDAPALAEWTRSAGPGDSLVITGSRLSDTDEGPTGSDTRFVVFAQSGETQIELDAAIQRLSGDQVAITLPTNLPAWSTYFVWPMNRNGYGRPAVLNQTDAWWLGPDRATRGDSVSVFGRNLTHGNQETTSWIYLEDPAGNASRWLASTSANPCKADVTLPADLPNGTYRVWAHNGHGAAYGWSGPLTLTVDNGITWSPVSFNVKDFGALGNGTANDTPAIRAALAAARTSPYATIYFPAGVYRITNSLVNPPANLRWRGDGMDLSIIRAATNYLNPSTGMVTGRLNNVEFRDLTFDTGGNVRGPILNNLLYLRGSSNIWITNVRLSQELDTAQFAPLDIHAATHVVVRGCTFIEAGGIFLGTARQAFFENCDFRGVNDNIALIYAEGGEEISITHCTAADFDNTIETNGHGWAQGRVLAGSGTWGANRHLYFGSNRTIDLTVRPGFWNQNTGEQFMFEDMTTLYRGNALAATPGTVRLAGLTQTYTNQVLVVVGGTGIGQSRTIAAGDLTTGTLTVSQPWNLPPDTTSVIAIGHYLSRAAVYGNTFDGKPRAVNSAESMACTGVEPFGGCLELIVSSNTFHELRTGIANFSLVNPVNGRLAAQPSYFNHFAGNTFESCRIAIGTWVDRYDNLPVTYDACHLGNVARDNRMQDIRDTAFPFYTRDPVTSILMGVYEGNSGTNVARVANMFPAGLRDQIWIGNTFSGTGTDHGIVLNTNALPAVRENTLTGFKSSYSGYPPGPILEIPYRTTIGGDNMTADGAISIWNSGTSPLNWTGTTSVAWLRMDAATHGRVQDERSAGTLTFSIDAENLAPGTHEALITVSASGQQKSVTVTLIVPPPAPVAGPLGTPYAWLMAHGLTNNIAAAELDDPDGDGVPTWQEYIAGTVPLASSSALTLHIDHSGGNTIVWFASVVSTDANRHRRYNVESRATLSEGAWQPLANAMDLPATDDIIAIPAPAAPIQFLRLECHLD